MKIIRTKNFIAATRAGAPVATNILAVITTPDLVETRLGTVKFL